jgi:hypothetical protein
MMASGECMPQSRHIDVNVTSLHQCAMVSNIPTFRAWYILVGPPASLRSKQGIFLLRAVACPDLYPIGRPRRSAEAIRSHAPLYLVVRMSWDGHGPGIVDAVCTSLMSSSWLASGIHWAFTRLSERTASLIPDPLGVGQG